MLNNVMVHKKGVQIRGIVCHYISAVPETFYDKNQDLQRSAEKDTRFERTDETSTMIATWLLNAHFKILHSPEVCYQIPYAMWRL